MKRTDRRGGMGKKLLLGGGALVVAAAVTGWFSLPAIVKSRIAAFTGCPVEARVLDLNPFTGSLRIEDLRLRNPANFPVPDFVDLRLLVARVQVGSLMGDVLEVPQLHFELDKITVVTNAAGETNTLVLKQRVQGDAASSPRETPREPSRQVHFGELVIKVGRIEVLDYSRGRAEPLRRTIPLNINRRFTDVRDPRAIVVPIVADLARANAIGLLGGVGELIPGKLGEALNGALQGAGNLLLQGGGTVSEKAGDTLKKLIDSLPGGAKP